MRKVLLIIAVFMFIANINAQRENRIESLTYEDTQQPEKYAKLSKIGKTQKYTSKMGAVLKVGDTLFLREAFANLGKDAGRYSTILEGDPYDGGRQLMVAFAGTAALPTYLAEKRGEATIIEKIRWSRAKKKRPAKVELSIRSVFGGTGTASTFYVTDVELSFEYKEIYHRTLPMTKDDLVLELRKAKDELELGLMSQEDFEAVKAEVIRKLDLIKNRQTGI
ncbi:hypothetical protein [Lutimonas zeaxanthinifaciens]|uniref:hypothetical protein n=1 Tax=Lutimonas zeaxanthinifaciens TaxID=3060215 RepID=UPI00265CCE81|nr:hypothetical protein [Lutimonas sp. YSD2104]WKK67510.1 hypothetical protein QZH61_07745 [Lutimonas sp. YSD2104]